MTLQASARWPATDGIRLVLHALGSICLDVPSVRAVRAEDPSGSFSLWPGHEDFLTVLSTGVLSWRTADGQWRHAALRAGVLTMRRGCEVAVASREIVHGDDLQHLAHEVRSRMLARQAAEEAARRQARELEVRAFRAWMGPLRGDRAQAAP